MNLYCKEQKTFTKQGQDNWEKIFNNKFVVIELSPLTWEIRKCYNKNNKLVDFDNDEIININKVLGISDKYEEASLIMTSIRG